MYFDSSFLHSKTKSLNYHTTIPLATAVGKKSHLGIFIGGGLSERKKHQSFKSWMISRAFLGHEIHVDVHVCIYGENGWRVGQTASWALSLATAGPSSRCLRLKRAEGQGVTCQWWHAARRHESNSRSLSCLLTAFCLVLSSVFMGFLAVIWELKKKLGIGKRKGWY